MGLSLAFHDSTKDTDSSPNGLIFDKIISWRTKSPYVHVELLFDADPNNPITQCFSSVPGAGCRYSTLNIMDPQWVIILVPGNVQAAKLAVSKLLGQEYDWAGILGIGFDNGLHDDHDKFCSEACLTVLQDIGEYPGPKPWSISPGDLYKLVTIGM